MIKSGIKNFVILTLTFFIPVFYLPIYLTGLSYSLQFSNVIIISAALGLSIVLVRPILDFTTIKRIHIIEPLLGTVLVYIAISILNSYFNIYTYSEGTISLTHLTIIKDSSTAISSLLTGIISSILFGIWGIIINKLVD